MFKYFVLAIAILGLTSQVEASIEYGMDSDDINDIKLPPITFTSVVDFVNDYIRLCKKLVGRRYKRPFHQKEADGPLTYVDHRIVGTNLFEDVWNAFWGWILNPTEAGFWKIFAMFASYFVIPFYGGYIRSQIYVEYVKDEDIYNNAEITFDYLYMESMDLSKMAFWEFFGLLAGGGIRLTD